MFKVSTVLVSLLAILASGSALADRGRPVTVVDTAKSATGNAASVKGLFSQEFSLTTASAYDVNSASVSIVGDGNTFSSLKFVISNTTFDSTGTTVKTASFLDAISPLNLAASHTYTIKVFGDSSVAGATYSLKASGGFSNVQVFTPTSLAPVPEPETYAMLLAGLGLMGGIARRRSLNK
jgi:hypothetical protein